MCKFKLCLFFLFIYYALWVLKEKSAGIRGCSQDHLQFYINRTFSPWLDSINYVLTTLVPAQNNTVITWNNYSLVSWKRKKKKWCLNYWTLLVFTNLNWIDLIKKRMFKKWKLMLTKKGKKKIIRNAKNFDKITSLMYMWMWAHCIFVP